MTAATLITIAADNLSPPDGLLAWLGLTLALAAAAVALFVMAILGRHARRGPLFVGAGVLAVLVLVAFGRSVQVGWSPPVAVYVVFILGLALGMAAAAVSGLRLLAVRPPEA